MSSTWLSVESGEAEATPCRMNRGGRTAESEGAYCLRLRLRLRLTRLTNQQAPQIRYSVSNGARQNGRQTVSIGSRLHLAHGRGVCRGKTAESELLVLRRRVGSSFAGTCTTMVWWHLYGQHSALVLRVTFIQRLMQSVWNTCPHTKASTGSEPNSDQQSLHSRISSVGPPDGGCTWPSAFTASA